ncbi:MAG: RNase adapter RapZ [Bdellovibrionales bacterium]|nr:RNase adapter RapZ [Bdellovibrionales bacterium]
MSNKQLVIISGVSGSGKSTALNAFEDIGFFCVDNLPSALIGDFAKKIILDQQDSTDSGAEAIPVRHDKDYALLIDCRTEGFFPQLQKVVDNLKQQGTAIRMLYLDAHDDVLLRRFKETRRPHPLIKAGGQVSTVQQALKYERMVLTDFRAKADKIIDTSNFTPHELRRAVTKFYRRDTNEESPLELTIASFGFKYGAPVNADIVMDVRFMANPHFVPELRELTGLDQNVADYVFQTKDAQEFVCRFADLLRFLIPRYVEEGKCYLTVAVGCTGGKHRSVATSCKLAETLADCGAQVSVKHLHIDQSR